MGKDEILDRTEETIKKVNEMVEAAEGRIKETDRLYESLGITRGKISDFIDNAGFPPELKKQAEEERAKWQRELEEELQKPAASGSSHSAAAKLARKKNFIKI